MENGIWVEIPLGGKFCAGISLFGGVFPFGDVAGWSLWDWKDRVEWGRGIQRRRGIGGEIWAGIILYGGVFCMRIGAGRILWA